MEQKLRLHYVFRGEVQGVGFRYRAFAKARELCICGWVCNMADGSVEMEAQGNAEDLDALVACMYQASHIRITDMQVEKLPVKSGETGFRMQN